MGLIPADPISSLVCSGILGLLNNNELCCECRDAAVGVGDNDRLIGNFRSNCSMKDLRAAESEQDIADAEARVTALRASGETEEECGPPSCCLELEGAIALDSGNGDGGLPGAADGMVQQQEQEQQQVCTHSMAGCSTVCKSVAMLAPEYTDGPEESGTGSSAAKIVLPIILGLLALGMIALLVRRARQDAEEKRGAVDISIDVYDGDVGNGGPTLFKPASSDRPLGSRRLKNPLNLIGVRDGGGGGGGGGGSGLFKMESDENFLPGRIDSEPSIPFDSALSVSTGSAGKQSTIPPAVI